MMTCRVLVIWRFVDCGCGRHLLFTRIRCHSGTNLPVGGLGRSTTARAGTFFDDNTQVAWAPVGGGANVIELNKVLEPYDVAVRARGLPEAFGTLDLSPVL